MADPKSLRQRAGLLRLITPKSSPRGEGQDEPHLLAPVDHREREAALTEDRAVADEKPLALWAADDTAGAGIRYKGIERGQRYRPVGRSFSVWEVREVVNHPGLPVPHVRLIRVGSPKDMKTVSADILRSRRF